MRRNWFDVVVFYIIGGLVVYALSLSIINATVIPVDRARLAVAILASLTLLGIIFYNKYTFIVAVVLVVIALGVAALNWEERIAGSETFNASAEFLMELNLFVRGYIPFTPDYGMAVTWLTVLIISVYIALSLYVTYQFLFVCLLGFGLFILNWIMGYKQSDEAFLIFAFCFCTLLFKYLNENKPDANKITLRIMPLCAVIFAGAFFIPPMKTEWSVNRAIEFFQDPLDSANDFFYLLFNPKYYTFDLTGFSNGQSKLGGSISLNNNLIMTVDADRRTYLSGLTMDTYTGSQWIDSLSDRRRQVSTTARDSEFDLMNVNFAAVPKSDSDYYTLRQLTINIGKKRTGTIFRPHRYFSYSLDTTLDTYQTGHGDIYLSDVLPANAQYSFEYADIDYANDDVESLLRSSEPGMLKAAVENKFFVYDFYSSMIYDETDRAELTIGRSNTVVTRTDEIPAYNLRRNWAMYSLYASLRQDAQYEWLVDLFNDRLIPEAEEISEIYTQLPNTITPRVQNLAFDITKDADNNYDKARAIEAYLAVFPYTLTPDEVPEGEDFVDYFLFEGKEGYCTYYASAMAVLCRVIGLPAKFMEGYVMPAEKTNGVYEITGMQSHAWVEVFFEGFGWARFEPTLPYYISMGEESQTPNDTVFSPDFASDPYYEDYIQEMLGDKAGYYLPPTVPATVEENDGAEINTLTAMTVVAALVLLFVLGILFYGVARVDIRRAKLVKATLNNQAIGYMQDIMKMASYVHYPLRLNETPADFARRVGKRFTWVNQTIYMDDIVPIYYKARYGDGSITAGESSLLRLCAEEFLDDIKKSRHRAVYIWDRFITRRI
ncbi:MAG: transglutaminase-like domain-containing protein [Clostridiales bacterium]|jgi:transglutaminase-like putative cysteine protease|nr:transglutaminase-like domain-containing protein [Clostridiales bacterium]